MEIKKRKPNGNKAMHKSATTSKAHGSSTTKCEAASIETEINNEIYRKKFKCDNCGKMLSTKGSLQVHMQLHTGKFSHYCEKCRRGFSGATHYERHMRSHAGLKYQCDYCDKTFVDKGKLKHHLSVHTGEYKFKCDKCNKGFNARFRFLEHIYSHGDF